MMGNSSSLPPRGKRSVNLENTMRDLSIGTMKTLTHIATQKKKTKPLRTTFAREQTITVMLWFTYIAVIAASEMEC